MRAHHMAAVVAALLVPRPSQAQVPEPASTLSSDSVALGEVFEWSVDIPVPPESVVYFPDTLPATPDVESFAAVEWGAGRGPAAGATVTLTYPLIAFGTGTLTLPRLTVIVEPTDDDTEGERIPGGSRVGSWSEAPATSRRALGLTTTVWVEPAYTSDDILAGLSPRPPADVVGLGWSWPSIALVLVFATVLGGTVVTSAREWLENRPEPAAGPATRAPTLEEARRAAIDALDGLLAAVPHDGNDAFDVYARSSRIVRDYVEWLDGAWGPELTSTELMAELDGAGLADPELLAEMRRAEAVKFGRVRPASATTRTHLRILRSWLEEARP
ncbi:MAG: hypothetical protein PVJ80_09435 [Gemmatimonadota bacterium]